MLLPFPPPGLLAARSHRLPRRLALSGFFFGCFLFLFLFLFFLFYFRSGEPQATRHTAERGRARIRARQRAETTETASWISTGSRAAGGRTDGRSDGRTDRRSSCRKHARSLARTRDDAPAAVGGAAPAADSGPAGAADKAKGRRSSHKDRHCVPTHRVAGGADGVARVPDRGRRPPSLAQRTHARTARAGARCGGMLLVPTASPGSSWERTPSGPPSIHHPPSTIHHPPSTIHPPIRTAASVRQRRPPLVRHSRAWRLLLRPCGCVTLCAEERGQRGRRGQREQRPSRPAAVAAFKALPRRPPLLPSPSPLSTLRLPTVAAAVRLGSRPANRQQRPARTEERCMPARRGADSLRKKPSAPGKPVLRPSFLSVRPASSSAGFALETKPPRPSPLFVYESGCVRSFFPFSLSVRSLLALSLGPTDQPGCCRCCYVLPLFARQYAPPPPDSLQGSHPQP